MHHETFARGGWGGEALLGLLLPVLCCAGAVALVLLVLRASGRLSLGGAPLPPTAASPPPEDHALTLLRERYARGEIDTADYEERRRGLLDEPPGL